MYFTYLCFAYFNSSFVRRLSPLESITAKVLERPFIPLSQYFSLPIFHPSQIVFLSFNPFYISFLSYFISHHLTIFSTSLSSLRSFQSTSLFFFLRSSNILSLFFLVSTSTSGLCETSYIAAISSAVTTPDLEVEIRKKRDRILKERREERLVEKMIRW